MTEYDIGGLASDTVTGSISARDEGCLENSPSPSWEYVLIVHAYDDELMNQSYYEIRENKQNRWNIQVYFPDVPESPMPENSYFRSTTFSDIEYQIEPVGRTAGSNRVEFDDPVPNGGSSGNTSAGFSVSASASVMPGVSLSASIGYSFSHDSVTYDSAYQGKQDHSYWSIPVESGYSTDPEDENTTGISIDVECFSDYDDNMYEQVGIISRPSLNYTQNIGLGCIPNIYYKTLKPAYAQANFIVAPP